MKFCFLILLLLQFHEGFADLPGPTPTPIPIPLPVIDDRVLAQLEDEYGELETQEETLEEQLTELQSQTPLLQYALDHQGTSLQWSNQKISELIVQINGILESYSHIAYSAQDLDNQFKQYYPGYTSPNDFQTQYSDNLNDTLKTAHGALNAINTNMANVATEKTDMDTLHTQAENAIGQTAILQTLTEMSEMIVTQLQELREIIASQANSEMSYYATQIQTQASRSANLDAILAASSTDIPVYGSNPENNIYSLY